MRDFFRRYWYVYVILAALAIILGVGAAYYFGVKASTPSATRAEHIEAEEDNADFLNSLDG